MKYCGKISSLLPGSLGKYQKYLRWQYLIQYSMYVYTISTWLWKKENPAHETSDFMTLVYSYSEQYIHFYSLWRQRLLCDIHIHICSKTILLYYIQLELYTVPHSTSHFGLQQIDFQFSSIRHWWVKISSVLSSFFSGAINACISKLLI